MASDSPGIYRRTHHVTDGQDGQELFPGASGTKGSSYQGGGAGGGFVARDSGYYVSTSDGASTCSSSTTEAGEGEGGTLLVLEPKSLRSFTTNDEYLYAMKEDLADWFSCLYQNDDITAENFFQVLETGVLLCRHANKVQEFARQRREKGESLEMRSYFIRSVPEGNVPFREGVKPETFQARDNVSNFIRWGRQLGIPEVLSFETDDLVLRKNEKSVILCLLEIARVGAKLGMLAPTLVQMEQEIDAELAGEEPKPQVQIKTCDMRSLDERVRDLIGRCTCPVQFPMIKVGEGKYKIGDSRSLIFVRILRNHVMVRVGGGWDTLENYLNKHDPCQCMYRGHRAGGTAPITHKITVNQQRRASTPGNSAQRPAPNPPTSPRRMSAAVAAPERNRSASPQTVAGAQPRSKSPTLMISRSAVTPSKGSPAPEHKNLRGASSQPHQGVANKTPSHHNSNTSFNNSSPSQPARCKSPSPGRLRSPSPLTTPQGGVTRPSVLRTSSSSSLLKGKDVGGDNRTTTPRKITQGILSRSVSFDERAELPSVTRSSSSSLERVSESESGTSADGGGKGNVSMDKISTMTLSEFKSLLNSALSVPEEQQLQQQQQQQQQNFSDRGGGRSPGQSSEGDQTRQLNWDSLREKARSVRDSISSSVSSRRAGNSPGDGGGRGAGSYGVIGRRSLPQSPDEDRGRPATAMGIERPKTPKALRRNVDTSNANVISRPKTPTSSVARPKTPSRLERTGPPKEEYKMSRPKTPSQLKRDAVAKVAGAISNWVESRNEMDSSSVYGNSNNRPKTPTRPKTPVGSRSNMSQKSVDDYDDDEENNSEVAGVLANPQVQTIASTVRERPSTPSRIPKPCFTPRPSTPKALSSLAIDSPREDRSPSTAPTSHPPTRPNTVSATRPSLICRSNSNSSSVKSFDETTPSSPASSCGEDKSLRSSLSQSKSARKLPNVSESNSSANTGRSYKDIYTAKRSAAGGASDVRPQPSRAVTPGPREKWTIGGGGGSGGYDDRRSGTSSTASTPGTRRRGSLNTICQTEKPAIPKKPNFSGSQHRGTPRAPETEPDQGMSITNEITFSDDEEINELVKNAALKAKMSHPEKRVRSSSVDARRLVRQNPREKKEEVVMISRDSSGHHGVQVVKNNEIKYTSTPKSSVVKRPSSRGSSTDRSTPVASVSRFRSQTPEPYMFRQKISTPKTKGSNEAESVGASSRNGDKGINRTEAWVDSTLSDTKRKLPPRPKRAKGFGNDIPPSELEPRPLEEIKAILAEPKNGYVHVEAGNMDVPAEDPEMFKKMEKLFEKYREMELKASVNETPGSGNGAAVSADQSADSQSAKGGSQGSGHAASRSTPSVTSMKTSSGASSGVSSGNSNGVTLRNTSSSFREENRFKRSSSVPGSFQIQKSSSNNSSTLNSPSQEVKDFVSSGKTYQNGSVSQSGRGSGSSSGDHHKGPGSLRDIDPEVAKNPAALISKIKEILQVRPRKDENSRVKTRIPAPAGLNKYARSKSVSNLCSDGDNGLSLKQSVGRSVLNHTNHSNNNHKTLSKSNSTSSGNIAYSEYVFTDDAADEVPELARTMSVQSDSSDSQNRSETPIPKLAMPLTTGRSTLISRRGERFGRGLSQDKENNLSNSQSSLSSRSVLSATEDEADFV